MKPLIDYIKPHLLHSWEHAASFSHIRQRMTTPWQTCMLVWSLRRILVINMIIWLPVVVAYRYFVSLFPDRPFRNDRYAQYPVSKMERKNFPISQRNVLPFVFSIFCFLYSFASYIS